MSVQTNIILADGQTTPVSRTFLARGADMKMAVWTDTSNGVGLGMPQITLSTTPANVASKGFKTEARITVPVMEVISGSDGGYTPVPKVAFNLFAKVEIVCPNRASLQNRKDILAFTKNLLSHALMSQVVADLDPPN